MFCENILICGTLHYGYGDGMVVFSLLAEIEDSHPAIETLQFLLVE